MDAKPIYDWACRRLDWRYEKGVKSWSEVRILSGLDQETLSAQLPLAFPKEEKPRPRNV
jgi:hypothetical protein